jgi:hypothetical protein
MYKTPLSEPQFLLTNNINYNRLELGRFADSIVVGYYADYYGGKYDGTVIMTEEETILIPNGYTLLIKSGELIKIGTPIARDDLSNEVFYASEYENYKVGYISENDYGKLISIYDPKSQKIQFNLPISEYKTLINNEIEIDVSLYSETINFTDYDYKLASNSISYVIELSGIDISLDRGVYVTVNARRFIPYDYAQIPKTTVVKVTDNEVYVYRAIVNENGFNTNEYELIPLLIISEDEDYYYVKSDEFSSGPVYIAYIY